VVSHTAAGGHIVAGGIPGESVIMPTRTSSCSWSSVATIPTSEAPLGKIRGSWSAARSPCATAREGSWSAVAVGGTARPLVHLRPGVREVIGPERREKVPLVREGFRENVASILNRHPPPPAVGRVAPSLTSLPMGCDTPCVA
jgi:hypothetical protein